MSKRFFPQQYGERKKAKLDVTVSDHNFPLSQNVSSNKGNNQADNWGDDNDDEILLLASQACEEAYNEQNITSLADYSFCMKPAVTSTQYDAVPSTSKAPFAFKIPTSSPLSTISTKLKDKCERISSPLPGISSKVNKEHMNLSDDFIVNDKIFKGQDSDQFYKQLLQLQEENAKLKSENGKLLEKCVTKEGEATILRTQLKTCQMAVDNARMEKVKIQEKAKMEWMEKIGVANNQIHDLKNQLDFKNLEIISIKEKCKMLESSKIKLTQVTVGANDISASHKQNSYMERDNNMTQARRVKTATNSVQTDNQSHILKLNTIMRTEPSTLKKLLPLIIETHPDQPSILEYNEKLKKSDTTVNKCRVFNTFYRLPSTPSVGRRRNKISIASVYEDLTCIAAGERNKDRYINIFKQLKEVLQEVHTELSLIAQRVTTAFQREMDERYIDSTASLNMFGIRDLISGKPLYKEEQAILARRFTAVSYILLRDSADISILKDSVIQDILNVVCKICSMLDTACTGVLYSGLLISLTQFLSLLSQHFPASQQTDIQKHVILARPTPAVCVVLVVGACVGLCVGCVGGNLRMDYDQGVLLYKKDSCLLQVLLKQIETALKCMENQNMQTEAVTLCRNLLMLYTKFDSSTNEETRCDCQLVLMQVIVYALRICANMLKQTDNTADINSDLLSTCRSGIQVLYQCILRDVEFASRLGYHEGHLAELCAMRFGQDDVYSTMLAEISSTFQSSPEDATPSYTKKAWMNSFKSFSIAD
ncbi:unnamed protein product [Colias eurytheme]|nr:unnamed protein product [Colias eurytheme]